MPGWTSKPYLLGSVEPFSSLFKEIANTEFMLNLADILNEWGLILIGFSLFVGLFPKLCKVAGIALLLILLQINKLVPDVLTGNNPLSFRILFRNAKRKTRSQNISQKIRRKATAIAVAFSYLG